ncbi:hypothetical protein EJ05DRAFT_99400 [Pseudovirgaria hyperparasitica]|uniref:Uncharacterized protein n=1 Tax=Pseudovirgaria hyperparasitica TaxID=470096 RepID=A0A6A6VYL1_9PEZI|nr:uncharacterized protein EJ05DRAFT_99400 [Pseudovirgaria hyperparasitica]KAF2755363.1 hypothetical protein EJ05DRAFT_99400 [Pseudovirgaria hyperparasitica]
MYCLALKWIGLGLSSCYPTRSGQSRSISATSVRRYRCLTHRNRQRVSDVRETWKVETQGYVAEMRMLLVSCEVNMCGTFSNEYRSCTSCLGTVDVSYVYRYIYSETYHRRAGTKPHPLIGGTAPVCSTLMKPRRQ